MNKDIKKYRENSNQFNLEIKNLLNYYKNNKFDIAEQLSLQMIEKFPDEQLVWKILSMIFLQTERVDKAIDANKKGLARELARMNLTLNTYTHWYWKTDLLNLMNFLRLRADSHAQYEIRIYADIMLDTVKKWVPIAYDAFMDYRVGGTEVSAKGKIVIQKLIKGEDVTPESSGLSKREWNELMIAFDLDKKII